MGSRVVRARGAERGHVKGHIGAASRPRLDLHTVQKAGLSTGIKLITCLELDPEVGGWRGPVSPHEDEAAGPADRHGGKRLDSHRAKRMDQRRRRHHFGRRHPAELHVLRSVVLEIKAGKCQHRPCMGKEGKRKSCLQHLVLQQNPIAHDWSPSVTNKFWSM